ncbi:MAG: NUDIX domain-containing protein [Acidimicrobiales bacterium]
MTRRIEHYHDPEAPQPNSLVPAATAVVADEAGRILLERRVDNDLWALPGGVMEPGEMIAETAVREVREETGLEVEPTGLVGIYSDPNHIIEYADGEVRQQFSICFRTRLIGGQLRLDDESTELRWVEPSELDDLAIHPSIRLRIDHFLQNRPEPYVG